MRSDLSTVLALAARANAFFRGATGRMEVLAGHPAFARFHDLAFVRQTGLGGEMIAEGSVPWFRRLRNEGVGKVRPILAGMRLDKGPDLPWGILSEGDRGLELWSPGIGRRFQGHGDQQPLRLTMTSSRFDRWLLRPPLPVEEAGLGLGTALEAARVSLEASGQTLAASAVGKFHGLHTIESPEPSGELASIAPDVAPCALPLFASATRVLTLVETTGWMASGDESARSLADSLWTAARLALEATV